MASRNNINAKGRVVTIAVGDLPTQIACGTTDTDTDTDTNTSVLDKNDR